MSVYQFRLVLPPPTLADPGFPAFLRICCDAAKVEMSTIALTAEDLYDKDKVDLEQVVLDDVWTLLQSVLRFVWERRSQRVLCPGPSQQGWRASAKL